MLDTLALVSGLPADPHPVLDLLSRSWPEPEAALQRQALAEALTSGNCSERRTATCERASSTRAAATRTS